MRDACPFGLCDGSGFILGDDNTAQDCQCRPQRVARSRSRSLSAVIPRKYRHVAFERPPVSDLPEPIVRQVRGYVRKLDEHLRAGEGLWLYGDVGTGKTSLAMLVSQHALDAGHSVAIYSLPRLLAEIRDTFEDDAQNSYVELLDRLATIDLLHIDDVGAERTSPWVLEQLYAIVNARYEEERAVIITTNLDSGQLAEQITPRTVSRLEEMCEILPLYGEDRRRQRFEAPAQIRVSQADPYDPAGLPGL
jgi:DNA replication protein DnaC